MPPRRKPQRVRDRKPSEYLDAEYKQFLAAAIAKELKRRKMTQTEASYLMQDASSQISLVVNGQLQGFSTSRLERMICRLGFNIEHVLRRKRDEGEGIISYKFGREPRKVDGDGVSIRARRGGGNKPGGD